MGMVKSYDVLVVVAVGVHGGKRGGQAEILRRCRFASLQHAGRRPESARITPHSHAWLCQRYFWRSLRRAGMGPAEFDEQSSLAAGTTWTRTSFLNRFY